MSHTIRSINTKLGKTKKSYREIIGIDDALDKIGMSSNPNQAGLGCIHIAEDICLEAALTIASTAKDSSKGIGTIVLFSSIFRGSFLSQNADLAKLLNDTNLNHINFIQVSGSGCAAGLSAVHLANTILKQDDSQDVLIVGIETTPEPSDRLLDHAILSDSVVSFLVSATDEYRTDSYELIDVSISSSIASIQSDLSANGDNIMLEEKNKFLSVNSLTNEKINHVFTNNIFTPLKNFREGRLGFKPSQLYNEGVKDFGHALSCDSFINLDRKTVKKNELCLVCIEAVGHSGLMLLKAM